MTDYEGCSDGACILRLIPLRQHTNGGCRCLRDIPTPKRIAIKRKIDTLRQERDEAREAVRIMLADKYLLTGEQMTLDELYAKYPWLETDPTDDSDLLHYHNKPVGWGDGEPDDWEAKVEAGIPLTREELDDMEDRGR